MKGGALSVQRLTPDKLERQVWHFEIDFQPSYGTLTHEMVKIILIKYERASRETTKQRKWTPLKRLMYGFYHPIEQSQSSVRKANWFECTSRDYAWDSGDTRAFRFQTPVRPPTIPEDVRLEALAMITQVVVIPEPV